MRDRIGGTLSHLQEGIAGVRVIQAFGERQVKYLTLFAFSSDAIVAPSWIRPRTSSCWKSFPNSFSRWNAKASALRVGSTTFRSVTMM